MSRRLERLFTNTSEISRHLYCPICTDVFLDPTRLFCGHTFCKKCFTHWNKDHDTCPICRNEVHLDLASKDVVADKIIQDLEVRCVNQECIWTDRLENLEKHSKICVFAKKPDWLTQNKHFIEINDEKSPPSKLLGHVPHQNQATIGRQYINMFDRVLTMTVETQKLFDGMITIEPSRPAPQANSLVRQNMINNQSRHHPSFIEEHKEARRRRLHRDNHNTNNITPEVIVPKREPVSGHKDLNKKEQKTLRDEKVFFGVKSWMEVDGPAETGDDDVEIIMISSRSNTRRGSRRMRRNCHENIVVNNNDNADVLIKKRKTM